MLTATKDRELMVVELTAGVKICTNISSVNQPALRSGFAGYPFNPRWSVAKYQAWKTGRQFREALTRGEMVVRSADSMLVLADQERYRSQ